MLIFALLFVYVTDFKCAMAHFEEHKSTIESHLYLASSEGHEHHHEAHSHDHKHVGAAKVHSHEHGHEKKSESKGSCCKASTDSFFSSLANSHISKLNLKKSFLSSFNLPSFNAFISIREFNIPYFAFSRHLIKPKVPDIRTFIQSFII
jgi:hypothetical protein